MSGKLKVLPVSRGSLAAIVAIAEHLRTALPGWEDTARPVARGQSPSDLASDLDHLARHDNDGFLVATIENEVVGFAASYVRSRQLVLGTIWVLPEHLGLAVPETIMRRALAFGERAGTSDAAALSISGASEQALLYRHGLRPRTVVYRLALPAQQARTVGQELSKLLPGAELTEELLQRRAGSADLERLDRVVRGAIRPMDHEHWLSDLNLRLATLRDGQRIAAYAYGGRLQCGPVVASTGEAALAGIGWALRFAAESQDGDVSILVPATFESAVEHLLEAGATCRAVGQWMSRNLATGLDRLVLPGPTLL